MVINSKHDKKIKPDPPVLPWPFDTNTLAMEQAITKEDTKKQVGYLDALGSSRRTILDTKQTHKTSSTDVHRFRQEKDIFVLLGGRKSLLFFIGRRPS